MFALLCMAAQEFIESLAVFADGEKISFEKAMTTVAVSSQILLCLFFTKLIAN